MSHREHKPGVHEQFLVKRRLKLEGFSHEEALLIVEDLAQIRGVDQAGIDESRSLLTVAYDASVTSIDAVEKVLGRHHCDISHSWWNQFKERWYRVTDENVHDNSQHEPWSCHKLPPGSGR